MPKIKNIIIFVAIAAVFVLIYIYFIKGSATDTPALVSSPVSPTESVGETSPVAEASVPTSNSGALKTTDNSTVAREFLTLLLSVKSIKLDDSIFSDEAFINISQHDSSIILIPDGTEGRPNPFAPIGADVVEPN